MCPDVHTVHVREVLPQEPAEHPDFWAIWRDVCLRYAGPVDAVFASESYGTPLAETLHAQYIPVDEARDLMPVSGTRVRDDPLAMWEFLPAAVRAHVVRRVCIFGPESTGKSTLARDLASHFGTHFVHEYARPYLDRQGGVPTFEDIAAIARGQIASEDALAQHANRVMFCDTDVLTTTIWSDVLFGKCPPWLHDEAARRRYDLTLLLDVDVPWVQDGQRFLPDQRVEFFNRCEAALTQYGRAYAIVRGNWRERFEQAVALTRDMLSRSRTTFARHS